MGIIRSAITLAAVGIAANMVLKARREGREAGAARSLGSPSNSPSLAPGAEADSLFDSDSAKGESARSPGLPDFARGA